MRRKHESPILNARREMPQKALLFERAEERRQACRCTTSAAQSTDVRRVKHAVKHHTCLDQVLHFQVVLLPTYLPLLSHSTFHWSQRFPFGATAGFVQAALHFQDQVLIACSHLLENFALI